MAGAGGSGRVADLHKGAFWIYGVTAMVMREPLRNAIGHAAAAGPGSPEVQVEILRVTVILALMARQFLASGLYFDQVHLRAESALRFPRRSYPIDFLAGLLQFLLVVCASTAIALDGPFAVLTGAFLLFENMWLAGSAAMRLSTTVRIAEMARSGRLAFAIAGAAYGAAAAAGQWRMARLLPLLAVLALTCYEMAKLVKAYDRPADA
jgi:hypothetical protein